MLKIDPTVNINQEKFREALKNLRVNHMHIPLVCVKERGNRFVFIVYTIHDEDPIYEKIKDEDDEGVAEACRAAYFLIPKSRTIDYPRLVKALKHKVQGVMRKQRKVDASY